MARMEKKPPWVEAQDMRTAALRLVSYVEREQQSPDYRPLGTLFSFGPGGQAYVVPPVEGGIRDETKSRMMAGLAQKMGVSSATVDWSDLVSAMLGHLASWAKVKDELVARSASPQHGLFVLCPDTLDRERRALFGGHGGRPWRSVSADEMRRLIQGLPVVPLKATTLRGGSVPRNMKLLVEPWRGRWKARYACARLSGKPLDLIQVV